MNLPPSNVRELQFASPLAERFIVIRETRRGNVSYVEDTLMSRFEVIAHISEDAEHLRQIIAFDLGSHTSRDATDEITHVVIMRWAEDCKVLTNSQKEFVALCKGETFANCFQSEEA